MIDTRELLTYPNIVFRIIYVDAVRLLNACTNSNISISEGDEKVDMCGGLKALIEDGREEGREEGIMLTKKVYQLHMLKKTNDDIARECNIPVSRVKQILE